MRDVANLERQMITEGNGNASTIDLHFEKTLVSVIRVAFWDESQMRLEPTT